MSDLRPDSSSKEPTRPGESEAAATATPVPGKLLKRNEAARLLGVSTATIRRMEGSTLEPVRGADGVHRFREEHVRELVIHRVSTTPGSPDVYDAEDAAIAFDLFDQGLHPVDVVKRTKLHPRSIVAMHREWVSMRGGYLVTGDVARQIASLTWLLGSRPIFSGEDLLKCLTRSSPHACHACEQGTPELCADCAKKLSVNEATRRAAEVRLRQETVVRERELGEWDSWQFPTMRRKQRKTTAGFTSRSRSPSTQASAWVRRARSKSATWTSSADISSSGTRSQPTRSCHRSPAKSGWCRWHPSSGPFSKAPCVSRCRTRASS